MTMQSVLHRGAVLALAIILPLLAGCSAPGTYPDPLGPRDGNGYRIDPHTGVVLPGESQNNQG